MQTVGNLLRQARINQKLTLSQLSRQTKIPKKTLKALEKNRFDQLPPPTYIKGFIKNYSQVVNLDVDKTIAVFRRDLAQTKATKIIPQGLPKPLNRPNLQLSSRLTMWATALIFFLFLFGYLGFSLYQLYQPPKLTINTPTEGQEVASPVIVKGKTDHDATLTLDGKTLNLETDGRFTTVYSAPPGAAEIKFLATSRRQKSTTHILHLIIIN